MSPALWTAVVLAIGLAIGISLALIPRPGRPGPGPRLDPFETFEDVDVIVSTVGLALLAGLFVVYAKTYRGTGARSALGLIFVLAAFLVAGTLTSPILFVPLRPVLGGLGPCLLVRHGLAPAPFAAFFLQFLLESICPRLTSLQDDVRDQGLALHRMRLADDGGLGDLLVAHQGGLDLHRPDPVARDVDHVIDAAHEPEEPVLVHPRAVPGEVLARYLGPVDLPVPFRIVVQRLEHRGPRPPEDEISSLVDRYGLPFLVDDLRLDARERLRRGAGLRRRRSRERREQDHPGLRLPPRVDDRTSAPADRLLVPPPRLRVDRLADGPKEAQARQVVPLRKFVAPPHERPDRGRGRVQDCDVVFLDHPPEAVRLRPIRCALVHEDGRAVREGPIDDVRVPRDPAEIRGAPVEVFLLQIEDVLRRGRDADEIPAGRMP